MRLVVGVDEVGRGSWAGPVVAAAVLLSEPLPGLRDSKLLTRAQRTHLAAEIQLRARAIGLGWVHPTDIDQIGLTHAIRLAMKQAMAQITAAYDTIILDGAFNFLSDNPKVQVQVKADSLVPAVSAASIIAKVARDQYMAEQAKLFPGYGFERHVGYGTRLHREMLKRRGICELHRRSYKPIRMFS